MNTELTIVSGLWDMDRHLLKNGFERPFSHYIEQLNKLLEIDAQFYFYTSQEISEHIKKIRTKNVVIKIRELNEFDEWFCFFDDVQRIRNKWYSLFEKHAMSQWLESSPQANLRYYNPVVLSKMFMLNDASINNPFKSQYMIWLDAGITHTVHSGYFTHDHILEKINPYLDKFLMLSFPYEESSEIHGFDRSVANKLAGVRNIKYVCRGGLFGGRVEDIGPQNALYYDTLKRAFEMDEMGTEETIFSIMTHKHPSMYHRYMLESYGMISNFCEAVKNDHVQFASHIEQQEIQEKRILQQFVQPTEVLPTDIISEDMFFTDEEKKLKTALYFLAFNFPDQLKMTLMTLSHHHELTAQTMKYCIDNSTNEEAIQEHRALCQKFHILHLPMQKNLGICGGRQWIAEHFAKNTQADYYIFFEDDMGLCERESHYCAFGFIRWTDRLLSKCIHILNSEHLDFLKLSFSEFFGNHSKQWAWHNVPQVKREEYFPEAPRIEDHIPSPRTEFKSIQSFLGLPYALGDVYYSNWPTLFSKAGNQKMFLNTQWAHPYEQTWMSYAFTEMKEGRLKTGILLASMIEHNRLFHYSAQDRREN